MEYAKNILIQTIPDAAWQALSTPVGVDLHLRWLEHYSQIHNLTRVPSEDWKSRHVCDSLAPYAAGWNPGKNLLDLGTGAGFPGVPLLLAYPACRGALVESRKKVGDLLTELISDLGGAERVQVACERAETLGHQPLWRGQFDCVVTRAFASLPVIAELARPFLKPNGRVWCWKTDSTELSSAQTALELFGLSLQRVLEYQLPNQTTLRCVWEFVATGECPAQYPRRPGIPQKRPIGG